VGGGDLAQPVDRADLFPRSIIPQALPPSLAGMGNYLVGIFKDTPMLSVIGVAELMHTANAIGSETYRFLEPYTLVGVIFLAISLPTAAGIRVFEALGAPQTGNELMTDDRPIRFPLAPKATTSRW
jgi:polar amino acid transport system permease protein